MTSEVLFLRLREHIYLTCFDIAKLKAKLSSQPLKVKKLLLKDFKLTFRQSNADLGMYKILYIEIVRKIQRPYMWKRKIERKNLNSN